MTRLEITGPFAEPEAACTARSFLQTEFWGRFKARFGWRKLFFCLTADDGSRRTLLVLHRKLAANFSLAYVPWGPELPLEPDAASRARILSALAVKLKALLPPNTVFIRFDPPWVEGETAVQKAAAYPPLKNAAADIQPPDTVLLNLNLESEALLSQMKPKTRYNIRLAAKKVTVRRPDKDGLETFYALFRETAARDGIALHSIDYYRALFEEAASEKNTTLAAHLYIAESESMPIAGIITIDYGGTTTYLYGASSNEKRNLMAPYLLQWTAILDAKKAGSVTYDLFGIPPTDDPAHPMAGLFRFKTGFGGRIIHRAGSLDYPCRPLVYSAFRFLEGARKSFRSCKKRKTLLNLPNRAKISAVSSHSIPL
ncbi:MAG: peptidoglycan bridge formation glycyltransferase FemA/FemB family protein [Spirochaetaceae bacterium]|jgi:lipid II:glycine glycyltransferase (peptidoglycan interpeptide bridge formation enzyme)|nr:peptidoglycan bridge formation glycyltransferase FemA/FemB family protein [Spirochaetaceae bacterium]